MSGGKRVRAAIVGAGFVGPLHVEALRRLGYVDVVGVSMGTRERAREKAAELDLDRAYDSYEQLLEDESVEVVHNCTPNHLHFEVNRLAILAGKHVVSEKPLAMTPQESHDLLELLKGREIVHSVNFVHRGYPLVQQMREMVRRGEMGRVNLVHGSYLQDWLLLDTDYNWRVDPALGGASRTLADIGSHWLDLVQFVTGSPVTELCADFHTVLPRRHRASSVSTFQSGMAAGESETVEVTTEDCASLLLRFANGASGTMLVSQVSAGRKNRLWFEVDGSEESAAWNSEQPEELWIGHRETANATLMRAPGLVAPAVLPYITMPGGHVEGWPDAQKNMLSRVYEFIREGKSPLRDQPDFPTFVDGHRAMVLVDAALRSARQGSWVKVT